MSKKKTLCIVVVALVVIGAVIGTNPTTDDDSSVENEEVDPVRTFLVFAEEGKYVDETLIASNDVLINKTYEINYSTDLVLSPFNYAFDAELIELEDGYLKFKVLDLGENPSVWIEVNSLEPWDTTETLEIEMYEV